MDTVKLFLQNYDRDKLFQKFDRKYVVELLGSSFPHKSANRFTVPKSSADLLGLNFGDSVYAIEKNGEVILVKKVMKKDRDNIIAVYKYGRGKKRPENVLRINQKVANYLGYEQFGFTTCFYNKNLSLKICPVSLVMLVS